MKKLTSRKFIMAIIGVLTGFLGIQCGEFTNGTVMICLSIISYIMAEGYVDAKAVKQAIDVANEITNGLKEGLENDSEPKD